MGQESAYAYVSTLEALKNARLTQELIDKNEVGIIFGNDSTAKSVIESIDTVREKKDTTLVGSGAIFKAMNSTVTMNLATIFKLTGVNFTISAACASGSHAIGMAYHLVKSEMQNIIVCGGAQEINPLAMASFDGLGVFATTTENPEKASRPFDKDRNGLIPSGGGATVVVESYESAIKRGAPILGEIIGYGFSSNGDHISTPNVTGPSRAMKKALQDADLDASAIDYINAHATSTPVGDTNEAKAIFEVFGNNPYVSSTKSMTGHECWMAGASEVIYAMLMMRHSFIAPNINLENPDEDAAKLNLVDQTIDRKIDVFLSYSFGFGGTNSALIIKNVP
jgi:3-oxoacyl-[acyl-carrier-protein] synthase-1